MLAGLPGAFSSEVDPVRVKKTRQNRESRAPFRFNRNEKGSISRQGGDIENVAGNLFERNFGGYG